MYKILFISIFLVFSCSRRKQVDTVNYNLSGTVFDTDQTTPLVGATVSFLDYDAAVATTNAEGVWSIVINEVDPCTTCTLRFSYIKDNCNHAKAELLVFEEQSNNNFTKTTNVNFSDFTIELDTCEEEEIEEPGN